MGEDGGLGEVWGQQIRTVDELCRCLAHLVCVGGVLLPAVAHHGVDDAQGPRMLTIQAVDGVNLCRRTKETRIDGIELDLLRDPGVKVAVEHLGGVMHVEAGELGVCREERGWYGTDVTACGGEDGDGDAQRALAIAAEVMHGGDTWNVAALAFVQIQVLCF